MFGRHHEMMQLLRKIDGNVIKILAIVSPTDLSKEDASVLAATKKVSDAITRLPHPQPSKEGK